MWSDRVLDHATVTSIGYVWTGGYGMGCGPYHGHKGVDRLVCEGVRSILWLPACVTGRYVRGLVVTSMPDWSVCEGVWPIPWLPVCLTGRYVRGSGLYHGLQHV